MKKISLLILILLLTACATGAETTGGNNGAASVTQVENNNQNTASDSVRLHDDYEDALSIDVQLAIGTMQLEESELAVDEALATELLPLWRAVQSLTNSDTAAAAEVTAVLNQIQDTMAPEQVQAIAEMQLTQETAISMLAEGDLTFGRGEFRGTGEDGDRPEGGFGGGFPGGGPGGGPGGFPGGGPGGGQIDPSAAATRQAELAESGEDPSAAFMNRGMTNAVIRLLETKTGEITVAENPFTIMLEVVGVATGLTAAEIQAQTAASQSLAEIVEAHGGDVTAVQADIIERIGDTNFAQNAEDLNQFVTNMLNNTVPTGGGE